MNSCSHLLHCENVNGVNFSTRCSAVVIFIIRKFDADGISHSPLSEIRSKGKHEAKNDAYHYRRRIKTRRVRKHRHHLVAFFIRYISIEDYNATGIDFVHSGKKIVREDPKNISMIQTEHPLRRLRLAPDTCPVREGIGPPEENQMEGQFEK